jgi:dihydropteroate synthase
MTASLFQPVPQSGTPRPAEALPLAGGPLWFCDLVEHRRGAPPRRVSLDAVRAGLLARLSAPRPPICGLTLDRPRIMGVINVTPDSFSDGGRFTALAGAVAHARELAGSGADILDIGGESTRPGADPISPEAEIDRVVPLIASLRDLGCALPISVDTRNAAVAAAAFEAGADIFNDVSALTHDLASLPLAAASGRPVCLMHARGEPKTMQDAPAYDDVLLDVAGWLETRVAAVEAAGIDRAGILVDPGIGFGKTAEHNLALVRGLGALHGTGCAILFGASRKRFIGAIGGAPEPSDRLAGSIAVALEALRQGAQVIRVHDVKETRQAFALWQALNGQPGQ